MWVEMSFHVIARVSRVSNYSKSSFRAFAMAKARKAETTRALTSVWDQANNQRALDGAVRNKTIFDRLTRELKEIGIRKRGSYVERR